MTTTLDQARALDAADPLRDFRDRFQLPDGVIYLDGNSLGALPRTVPGRIADVVSREWGQDLIRSWNDNHWMEAPRRIGAKIAGLIGAEPQEVVVADTASINIFKLLSAALQLRPERSTILTEAGNFPTDAYMIAGMATATEGRVTPRLVPTDQLIDALDEEVAVLLITQTHYKTGHVHDMRAVTQAAHEAGALVIWDLCHSAGALPVDLDGCRADFAVGCGYKYLNGGPGAPSFLYVAERHQNGVMPVLSGWLGHARPFDFSDTYTPADGIDRFRCSSPGILGMAALECGIDIALDADMDAVRAKSVALCELFIEQVEAKAAGHGFTLASPREADRRGSQVSFCHEHGYAIVQAMIARGVIGDFREPDILRFGFTPLYVGYEDTWRAADILADIMDTGAWKDPRFAVRAAVT